MPLIGEDLTFVIYCVSHVQSFTGTNECTYFRCNLSLYGYEEINIDIFKAFITSYLYKEMNKLQLPTLYTISILRKEGSTMELFPLYRYNNAARPFIQTIFVGDPKQIWTNHKGAFKYHLLTQLGALGNMI